MPLPVRFGLFIGLSQLLATLVVFFCGLHASAEGIAKAQRPESILGFIALMVLLGLAHRAGKKAALARGETTPTFGRVAKATAFTALVAGLSAGVFQWIYAAWINPRLAEVQRAHVLERVEPELAKLSPEETAVVMQQIDFASSPLARGLVFLINTFLFSLILGLAYALIFRAAARREAEADRAK